LQGLLVGGAGVANLLYPGIVKSAAAAYATVASPSATKIIGGGPDRTFAEGRVAARSDLGVILESAAATRAVRIPTDIAVWKEFDVPAGEIQLGDWVDVKGEVQADGSLLAKSGWIWVNLGRWEGVVSARGTELVVTHHTGVEKRISFSERIDVIYAHGLKPVQGGTAAITSGQSIGAVGLMLSDGSLRATRIWINQ
jgi:hypothetical protein